MPWQITFSCVVERVSISLDEHVERSGTATCRSYSRLQGLLDVLIALFRAELD